ncbi:DUF7009 family protein [Mucilaginibacter gotjawali]|uniref:Uncharacterized protein n=2 Tax=Mucilaginibacter gotjawali TaxID=1550579 RepID=A0A839S736_9SPHI|nr:hypothetical protein [Mucilaginibacter gotjawali]MBB3053901.1 hypothetical protein [Mucilaginibacter gotjawali]BAU54165.1 hypothetical protein MgSA37_02337 [Mucilaginibacter gotjawali]
MKIRINGNSVRFRLTRSDVKQLAVTGRLEEKVNFGGALLCYAIKLGSGNELTSSFQNSTIILYMPERMVGELADTDKVGFENRNGELYLLVEKDFTCLDSVSEDQSDNYPNPLAKNFYEEGD